MCPIPMFQSMTDHGGGPIGYKRAGDIAAIVMS